MLKEFKEFAVKGNVIDMAVGIIVGGAFGTIVNTLVSQVLMPPLGLLVGGVARRQQPHMLCLPMLRQLVQ